MNVDFLYLCAVGYFINNIRSKLEYSNKTRAQRLELVQKRRRMMTVSMYITLFQPQMEYVYYIHVHVSVGMCLCGGGV